MGEDQTTLSVEPALLTPLSLHRIVFRAVVLAACGALAMGIAAAAGFVAVADDLRPGWLRVGVVAFAFFLAFCAALVVGEEGARWARGRVRARWARGRVRSCLRVVLSAVLSLGVLSFALVNTLWVRAGGNFDDAAATVLDQLPDLLPVLLLVVPLLAVGGARVVLRTRVGLQALAGAASGLALARLLLTTAPPEGWVYALALPLGACPIGLALGERVEARALAWLSRRRLGEPGRPIRRGAAAAALLALLAIPSALELATVCRIRSARAAALGAASFAARIDALKWLAKNGDDDFYRDLDRDRDDRARALSPLAFAGPEASSAVRYWQEHRSGPLPGVPTGPLYLLEALEDHPEAGVREAAFEALLRLAGRPRPGPSDSWPWRSRERPGPNDSRPWRFRIFDSTTVGDERGWAVLLDHTRALSPTRTLDALERLAPCAPPQARAALGALVLELGADPALRPRCLRLAPLVAGTGDERARAFVLEALGSSDPAARDAGLAAGWDLALPEARAAVTEELTSLVSSLQGNPPADSRDLRWLRALKLCHADAEHQAIGEVLRALDAALVATSRRAP